MGGRSALVDRVGEVTADSRMISVGPNLGKVTLKSSAVMCPTSEAICTSMSLSAVDIGCSPSDVGTALSGELPVAEEQKQVKITSAG